MNKLPVTKPLTQKREKFCLGIVIDELDQTAAYKAAGYSWENMKPETVYQAASRLAADSKVLARIRELRDQITAGKAWSFQHGMEEVETNITQARELNQMAAAIRGTEQALKLSGLLVERPADQVTITKVTVVLSGPAALRQREGGTTTQSREIVDSTSRMLDSAEEE